MSQLHCKILHCKIENKDEGIEKITQRSVLFFSMRSTKQVSGLFSPFLHLDPQFCDTSFFWTVACDCGRCVFRSLRCSISLLAKACHHHHSHHGNTSSMPHNHTTTATCTVTAATSSASESERARSSFGATRHSSTLRRYAPLLDASALRATPRA